MKLHTCTAEYLRLAGSKMSTGASQDFNAQFYRNQRSNEPDRLYLSDMLVSGGDSELVNLTIIMFLGSNLCALL